MYVCMYAEALNLCSGAALLLVELRQLRRIAKKGKKEKAGERKGGKKRKKERKEKRKEKEKEKRKRTRKKRSKKEEDGKKGFLRRFSS
jgi:hypothetical protein